MLVAVAAATAAEPEPTVRLVSLTPPTVRGTGFAAQERVRTELTVGRRRPIARRTTANEDGRFTIKFDLLLALDPCDGAIVVRATGSSGSRATVKKPCRPPYRPGG